MRRLAQSDPFWKYRSSLKISFILPTDSLSGGVRVVGIYAQKLKELGHDVLIVARPPRPESFKRLIKKVLTGEWLRELWMPRQSFLRGLTVRHHILEKHRPVEDEDLPDADVVIATWWETAEWVAGLSAGKGKKVYFVQGYEAFEGQPFERVKKIVVSRWLFALMNSEFGDNNVSLVPNSVDLKMFQALIRSKRNPLTVGMMYGIESFRGSDIGITAYLQAKKEIPLLRLLLFGKAPRPSELPKEAQYFRNPHQEDLKKIYSQCDAWLFTSRTEGFGLPVLEAMACRTPVIATPAGAAPELLATGGGILVRPEDPNDMAQAILRVCQMSEEEWKRKSDAAYKQATKYTWDDAAQLFERTLLETLQKQSGNRS